MDHFQQSSHHILAELERIDLLVRAQVWRARQLQAADPEFQGLYISEQEVDALLSEAIGRPRWTVEQGTPSLGQLRGALEGMAREIATRKAESARLGIPLRLEELVRLFGLTPFERDVLLVGLAPELDLRYQKLYAYLQDDLTRKRPSLDLVLNLLCPSFEAKLEARRYLGPGAPLLTHHLVQLLEDPAQPNAPLLARSLQLDERLAGYLLAERGDEPDRRLWPHVQVLLPDARMEDLFLPESLKERLQQLARSIADSEPGAVLYLQGPYGVGKQAAAQALCRELGLGLLVVDGEGLMSNEQLAFEQAVTLAAREALLQNAAVYWQGFDALLAEDQGARRRTLFRILASHPRLSFLAGNVTWEPAGGQHRQPSPGTQDRPFLRIPFPQPGYGERRALWVHALDAGPTMEAELDLDGLADKFRLSGGQIRDAAATARSLAYWRDPTGGRPSTADLYEASRLHSSLKLGSLAVKITPHYTWDDIVLPAGQLELLRAICSFVKHRARVYYEWGFDVKLSLGKGLNALFAGPSGTGKTMAAEIVAHELGLELVKIDLSGVVSKYIGETEKNLARIFQEAETSNAILFFDEADALFGKRSEVKDAHDRYANIEISYLLQKMEEYEGVVILATNLRRNLDDAFVRRMAFTLQFPFPDEADRLRIWQQIWPPETPLAGDLDLAFMARQFRLAGGNIKNVALAAAFLAAEDGQTVTMEHLIVATRRELQKMGKSVVDGQFGEYAGSEVAKRSG